MEEETLSVISIFAIVISLVALIGVSVVYSALPQEESNPVTWGAIDQYNDKLISIQDNVEDIENDIKILDFEINNIDYNIDDDDLEDLEDYANEFRHIEENQEDIRNIISCLSEANYLNFSSCLID